MTRRNYVEIAAVVASEAANIRSLREGSDLRLSAEVTLANVVIGMVRAFEVDNPRFDRERFIAACGLTRDETRTLRVGAALVEAELAR